MSESLYKLSTIRLTLYDAIIPNCSNFRGVTCGSFGKAWLAFKNVSTGASSVGLVFTPQCRTLSYLCVSICLECSLRPPLQLLYRPLD